MTIELYLIQFTLLRIRRLKCIKRGPRLTAKPRKGKG